MRLADAVHCNGAFRLIFRQNLFDAVERRRDGIVEFVLVPVQAQHTALHRVEQGVPAAVVLRQDLRRFQRGAAEVIQLVRGLMQIAQIGPAEFVLEYGLILLTAAARPEQERHRHLFPCQLFQRDVVMVGIHRLIRMAVDVQQRFKAAVEAAARLAEVEQAGYLTALDALRDRDRLAQPQEFILAAEPISQCERLAVERLGDPGVHLVVPVCPLHGLHRGDALRVEIASLAKLLDASQHFFQCKKQKRLLLCCWILHTL